MSKRFIQVMVLIVIMAIASADAMASVAAAMLRSNGGVSVNGSAALPTTTVFSGDLIETAPNSAVTLTTNGSSVLVGQNSSLIFNGKDLSFSTGGAVVKSSKGLVAKFRRVVITPAQSATRFQLLQKGNVLTVAALEGSLSIFDGKGEIALVAGKQVDIPLESKERDKSGAANLPDSSTTGNSPAGGSVPGPTASSEVRNGLIVAGGAVGAVALIGLLEISQKAISPNVP